MKLINFLALSQVLNLPQTIGFSKYVPRMKPIDSQSFRKNPMTALNLKSDSNQEASDEASRRDELRNIAHYNYGIPRNKSNHSSFGRHTLNAINVLKNRGLAENNDKAFEIVKGLNEAQAKAVSQYDFPIEDVKNKLTFGEHTINAFEFLKSQHLEMTEQEIYKNVIDLSSTQVKGLISYGLSLGQVNTQHYKDTEETI